MEAILIQNELSLIVAHDRTLALLQYLAISKQLRTPKFLPSLLTFNFSFDCMLFASLSWYVFNPTSPVFFNNAHHNHHHYHYHPAFITASSSSRFRRHCTSDIVFIMLTIAQRTASCTHVADPNLTRPNGEVHHEIK